MKKKDEFYIGYLDHMGSDTKKSIRVFVIVAFLVVIGSAIIFGLSQNEFKNSSFELYSETKLTGVYHESPYPMLQVEIAPETFKSILLLGFGKSSVNPFFETIKTQTKDLNNKKLMIEGNLIYYNGKTLLQITDEEKITLIDANNHKLQLGAEALGQKSFNGEVIDPKCFFGVMKPGFGKIHRSCAVRCISGGVPPVFAVHGNDDIQYLLIVGEDGKPMNKEMLSFVGQSATVTGRVEKLDDWYLLKINAGNIDLVKNVSQFYEVD